MKRVAEKFPNDVNALSATTLPRSVRSAQNYTCIFVKSWINEAQAQTYSAGKSAPTFAQSAWKKMKLSIDSSQPVFDTARRPAKAGGRDGRVRVLSVINRADAITAAAVGGLMRQQLRPPR